MDPVMLREYRDNKDTFFASSPHSPLDRSDQLTFRGLTYFDPNPALIFTVTPAPGDGAEVTVGTSDGSQRTYRRAATVAFEVSGTTVSLTLFDTGHPGLFLPFRDATAGAATYGAGRYLDLHPNSDGTVTIDFNLAYNPFCAYTDAYSCALPPHENWLDVAIAAGELVYEKDTIET